MEHKMSNAGLQRNAFEFDGSCASMSIGEEVVPMMSITYGDDGIVAISLRSTVARLLFMQRNDVAFDIEIGLCHPDIGADSDLIVGVRLIGAKSKIEASAQALFVTLTGSCDHVLWTKNRLRLSAAKGNA